jgi:hypothetical protein
VKPKSTTGGKVEFRQIPHNRLRVLHVSLLPRPIAVTDRYGRFPLFPRPFYDGCSFNYFLNTKNKTAEHDPLMALPLRSGHPCETVGHSNSPKPPAR